ncbi:MAG: hypothetical protein KDD92_01405 [Caldilineaceae bacterium]|nr:hypothetical protein [Caldilineaceae bacterium]
MNLDNTQLPRPDPLTGIIRFLAVVGLLTIFGLGTFIGVLIYYLLAIP